MFICGLIFQKLAFMLLFDRQDCISLLESVPICIHLWLIILFLTFTLLFHVFNDFVAIVCILEMTFQFTEAIVTLATIELETLVSFYTQFLSIEPTTCIPNVYAEFQFASLKLGIFQPKKKDFSEFQNSAKSKMSLCLEVSDLESAIAHLTALGYSPPGAIITASHGREIYAYDPDGNRIILHQSK